MPALPHVFEEKPLPGTLTDDLLLSATEASEVLFVCRCLPIYLQLIECQVSSGFVSNGPILASTCTLNLPLKIFGARHEYLQVPPQPYLKAPVVRVLPAPSTILKPGAGCHCPFFWTPPAYFSPA